MPRHDKTLLDYLVIAICPLLIMVMVGSMAYYLLDVFGRASDFSADHQWRIRFIIAMFVMAIVLIGRVSIEFDTARSLPYIFALGGVTLLAVWRFAPMFFLPVSLIMILIWWISHKLTWNCTFIDEEEEDRGVGLLDAEREESEEAIPPETSAEKKKKAGKSKRKKSIAERIFLFFFSEQDKVSHAPGVWILYFSLAAIPVFVFGEFLMANAPEATRHHAFACVVAYSIASMALLMSTSILGLRRYLRRRNVPMSGGMASAWLMMGAVIIFVFCMIALLLPRPGGDFPLPELAELNGPDQHEKEQKDEDEGPKQSPNRWSVGSDAAKDSSPDDRGGGKNSRTEQVETRSGDSNAPGNQEGNGEGQGQNQQQSAQGPGNETQGSESRGSESRGSESRGSESRGSESRGSESRGSESRGSESRGSESGEATQELMGNFTELFSMLGIGTIFRWLLLLGIVILVVMLAIMYREELLRGVKELLDTLRGLFSNLFPRKTEPQSVEGEPTSAESRRRLAFHDLKNPFLGRRAKKYSTELLIQKTFEAIEVWGAEREIEHWPEETASEYLSRIARSSTIPEEDLQVLREYYCRVVYAALPDTPKVRQKATHHLSRLWKKMSVV